MGLLPAHNLIVLSLMALSHREILKLDASSLSNRLKEGSLTAVDLMEATLARIDQLNPSLVAIVLLRDRQELFAEAKKADHSPRQGWLHGIPIAIKDLSHVEGLPTTMGGSPLFQDFIPSQSDPFVQRLIDAGAIIIGKTNTPESGLGSHTFNSRWGTTLNPYNPAMSAGGSSGGAAVAVATRMLTVADGSDMMGSLRNPAGWNNLYSIRPTAGMLEYQVVDRNPLDYPISTVGPMARTVDDLARYLETMAGSDKFKASETRYAPDSNAETFQIAWAGDWNGHYAIEEGILPLCQKALDVFDVNGNGVHSIQEALFPAEKLWESWTTIRSAVVSSNEINQHDKDAILSKESSVRRELQWEVNRGLSISSDELVKAEQIACAWSDVLGNVFDEYDAIALPSAQLWPFPADWDYPKAINGISMDTYHRWMEIVVPGSLAGLPCVTIPAGFGSHGFPMGIQLMGRRGEDAKLLRLAKVYHSATDWPARRQPPKIA